jgi:hypothetical protein
LKRRGEGVEILAFVVSLYERNDDGNGGMEEMKERRKGQEQQFLKT